MTLLAVVASGRGVLDPAAPAIHADDEGFLRGRAAFETVRVHGGRAFRLDRHLDRLDESARRLRIAVAPRDEAESLAATALEQAGVDEAVLRLYRTPGREGAGEPVTLVLVSSLPPGLEELRAHGICLVSLELGIEPVFALGGVKSTSYALNMVAIDRAREAGGDDALLLGSGRIVLEGATSNVWWRSGRTLHTPSLDLGILAGVTRETVWECAAARGFAVEEGRYNLAELVAAEEAFTSSSIREVMPIVQVDGATIGDGAPGPAAAELQQALLAAY